MAKPDYIHTQHGTLITLLAGGILATVFWFVYNSDSPKPLLVLTFLLLLGIMVLFSSLTTIVYKDKLRCQFKGGLLHRTFYFDDIVSVSPVKNHWLLGWGVRKIPRGWMFNISGLRAVELTLKNGRKFRIGTDEPEKLTTVILAHKME